MSDEEVQTKLLEPLLLSVDPGVNNCGCVVIDPNNNFQVKDCILIKNARAFTPEEKVIEAKYGARTVKVQAIYRKVEELILKWNIGIVVIEAPFYNSLTPNAFGSLIEVIMAIKHCVITRLNVDVHLVEPTLVKRMFTNKGNAKKEEMRQFLINKKEKGEISLPFDIEKMSEHEVDGVAIGYTYYLKMKADKLGEGIC